MYRHHVMFLICTVSALILVCTCQHLGRIVEDDPYARELFRRAEENRTQDGYITFMELQDIFEDFDIDGNGTVTEGEFLEVWKEKSLGPLDRAKTLFHHADTDNNGVLTQDPDLTRVFYYFDRDRFSSFDLSTSEEDLISEMHIWCTKFDASTTMDVMYFDTHSTYSCLAAFEIFPTDQLSAIDTEPQKKRHHILTLLNTSQHPGRPHLQDDPEARELFMRAEENRTRDGRITMMELEDIFEDFDLDGNGTITEEEFLEVWEDKKLGTIDRAKTLFHHADTDTNGVLTKDPDLKRVFYYFDRDGDGFVNEAEFFIVWNALSL